MVNTVRTSASLWSAPIAVDSIADEGRHVDLAADEPTRTAIAKVAGLRALPLLTASFDVARRARGVEVTGRVEATVGQTCVVTLEPIENRLSETVDLIFAEPSAPAFSSDDPPEPLVDGLIDLGAIAVEFLMLGIDPYPRKAGVDFVAPAHGDTRSSPFSALARLKKDDSSS